MSTVQLKRSAVASKIPTTSDVALGELALNTYDGRLFFKKDPGTASIVTVATTDDTQTLTNKTLSSSVISGTLTANGSVGTAGQVLTSNASGVYWSTVSGGGGGGANLTLSSNGSTVSVNSDSGTDVIILAANSTTAGVLTAEAQTIAGVKTFSSNVTISAAITANGSVGTSGQVLTSNATGVYWSTVSGGGSSTFISLTDVPSSYTGAANKLVAVSAGATGLGFTDEIQISEFVLTAMSAPTTPSSDSMSIYVTASGTTPNREVAYKIKNELGQEIILSSILV